MGLTTLIGSFWLRSGSATHLGWIGCVSVVIAKSSAISSYLAILDIGTIVL